MDDYQEVSCCFAELHGVSTDCPVTPSLQIAKMPCMQLEHFSLKCMNFICVLKKKNRTFKALPNTTQLSLCPPHLLNMRTKRIPANDSGIHADKDF